MQDIHPDSVTPLRSFPKRIEAVYYNGVRLALRRLGCPLRLDIARQPVEMILDERRWTAFHTGIEYVPLLMWTDFITQRTGLHEPVSCTLHLYHVRAGLIMGKILDALVADIEARLRLWREGT
ncbi:MAG: hypothetical protein M1392_04460 [Gammaproteobacteria bacterium]|nr:hypothetical protein [Gammaproteobacteria bacterium]